MTNALAIALLVAPAIPASEIPPPHRWGELVGAPPAEDRYRFPDSRTCEAAITFNDSFRSKVGKERETWPEAFQWRFQATLDEAEYCREVWCALAWAQWPGTPAWPRPDWQKRLDLRRLRDLIGYEDFAAGKLPPPVPSWRLRELK